MTPTSTFPDLWLKSPPPETVDCCETESADEVTVPALVVAELEIELLLVEPDCVAAELAEEDAPIEPSNNTIINDRINAKTDDLNNDIANFLVVSLIIFLPPKTLLSLILIPIKHNPFIL
jgi:hypothetical protein